MSQKRMIFFNPLFSPKMRSIHEKTHKRQVVDTWAYQNLLLRCNCSFTYGTSIFLHKPILYAFCVVCVSTVQLSHLVVCCVFLLKDPNILTNIWRYLHSSLWKKKTLKTIVHSKKCWIHYLQFKPIHYVALKYWK